MRSPVFPPLFQEPALTDWSARPTCTDGIAGSITIALINYVLLGWEFPVDGYYLHSFEIWLATTVVFYGSGNLGFTLLEYRLGERDLLWAVLQNLKWIPFLYVLPSLWYSICPG